MRNHNAENSEHSICTAALCTQKQRNWLPHCTGEVFFFLPVKGMRMWRSLCEMTTPIVVLQLQMWFNRNSIRLKPIWGLAQTVWIAIISLLIQLFHSSKCILRKRVIAIVSLLFEDFCICGIAIVLLLGGKTDKHWCHIWNLKDQDLSHFILGEVLFLWGWDKKIHCELQLSCTWNNWVVPDCASWWNRRLQLSWTKTCISGFHGLQLSCTGLRQYQIPIESFINGIDAIPTIVISRKRPELQNLFRKKAWNRSLL
jgi:hypothetical protein